MIIDCHCHAGRGDGLTGPWDTNASLEKYLPRALRAGIDRTVLLAAFHSDYSQANREVARIVASRPNRFYGFAFAHPERDRGRVAAMVEEAVTRYGFVGIKVHRRDSPITREICDVARGFSLPVIYDVTGAIPAIRQFDGRGREKSSSGPTGRGCIRESSWRRSRPSRCLRRRNGWCWAKIFCG